MCVNDILTSGAEPLFFLDYLATGKLRKEKALDIVRGLAKGCREAGCSLIGGETAEMPGFYANGEYDLSGFAVGVVDRKEVIDGSRIKAGDAIIGLASNGLHSNGYSLVRRLFFDQEGMSVRARVPGLRASLGEELLRPTRIYVKAFTLLKDRLRIKGMAHITGGGIPGNLPRIMPAGICARIQEGSWPVPHIFNLIGGMGRVPREDMRKTFNMGIGFVGVVGRRAAPDAINTLRKAGYPSYLIGNTGKGGKGVRYS